MTRVFTKDLGRWKKGDIREYPTPTWQHIERGVNQKLTTFSKEVEAAAKMMFTESPTTQTTMNRKVV